MRIAITGPFGFVGSRLTPQLQKNHHCRTLSRQPSNEPNSAVIDYDKPKSLTAATAQCDTVIHLGGMAHLPQNTPQAQADIYKSNVTDTLALARAAANNHCQRFIFISSIKVNGEETFGTPFKFDDKPAPEDYYGHSKLAAEQGLQELCKKSGMELTIIRPGLVYGPNNKGNLAALEKLIKLRIPLPLKSLNNKRSLIHINRLCELISQCCIHPDAANEIFLAADPKAISSAEIARQLASLNKLPYPVLIPFPVCLLKWMATKLAPLKKLTGNLEIDTLHTQETLK